MEKEFLPYELALKMKALGFDKPCFAFYQKEYTEIEPTMVDDDDQYELTGYRTCKNSEIPKQYTSAPTYSQAFRWFREKHGLYCGFNEPNSMMIRLEHNNFETIKKDSDKEAELACLVKLIEIVKTK